MRERMPTFAPGYKGYLSYEPSFRAQIVRATTGMKVFGISKTQMKEIELHFPPLHDEQRAIVAVLSGMDAEVAALEGKLAKARDVKQGIMQVLLTGEVRLI
jgi:type I restriction enzyme, S subunit